MVAVVRIADIFQAVTWRSSTTRSLQSCWLSQWTRALRLFTSWPECVQSAWVLWKDGELNTGIRRGCNFFYKVAWCSDMFGMWWDL